MPVCVGQNYAYAQYWSPLTYARRFPTIAAASLGFFKDRQNLNPIYGNRRSSANCRLIRDLWPRLNTLAMLQRYLNLDSFVRFGVLGPSQFTFFRFVPLEKHSVAISRHVKCAIAVGFQQSAWIASDTVIGYPAIVDCTTWHKLHCVCNPLPLIHSHFRFLISRPTDI